MTDRELFMMVFDNFTSKYKRLSLLGTIVCYNGKEEFNISGYNLCYNLLRLTKLLERNGELE